MLKTWSSGDALTIRVFGKEAEVSVFSLGDSRFDENEDCREDGFPLNREELDCLNWFLENVNISDCRREIAAYCNAMYTGTGRPPVKESNLEQEIQITGIAVGTSGITQSEDGALADPQISFMGECECDPEHGICIGFRDQKFLGIHAQDWML
nr:hypothetical protein [uncultured Oscillibacter sp.]